MKKKYILFLAALFTLIFASSAMASENKELSQKKSINGYEVELVTSDPAIVGEQDINVNITKDNAPVKSLPVKIMAQMDKSDDSMEMGSDKEKTIEKQLTEGENGAYLTKVNFEKNGKWVVSVMFGDMQKVDFNLDVQPQGTNWTTLGGFMGVIALFIIVATIFKKKKAPVQGN